MLFSLVIRVMYGWVRQVLQIWYQSKGLNRFCRHFHIQCFSDKESWSICEFSLYCIILLQLLSLLVIQVVYMWDRIIYKNWWGRLRNNMVLELQLRIMKGMHALIALLILLRDFWNEIWSEIWVPIIHLHRHHLQNLRAMILFVKYFRSWNL